MFKYCKIDKYSLENIKQFQVWCNHFQAFNDPFECWCNVNTGIPDPHTEEERFFNVIKIWGFKEQEKELALQDYSWYLEHFIEDQIDVGYMLNSARISCFCEEPDNLLMWSHYADGLRGFCLELELMDSLKDAVIIPVQYLNKPPTLETIMYPLANDIYWHSEDEHSNEANLFLKDFYSKLLGSKPFEWSYENEKRLIFHSHRQNKIGEAYKYFKEELKSVIIGEKMKEEDLSKLQKIMKINGMSIPLKKAKRDKSNYGVLITEL